MSYLIVTGLDLEVIHTRCEGVLEVMNERKCSLAQAMNIYGVARNTLRDFIGICELKMLKQG